MNRFLFVALLSLSSVLSGQINLVPNPSFEDTVSCPTFSGITYATSWINSGASPDYYNSCANTNTPAFGIPFNWLGNQAAFHGNAYAGIVLWYVSSREFIGISLEQPLVPGTQYFVSAYVSRGDSADTAPYTCSCNKFGFRFSTVAYDYSQSVSAPVDNYSHVHSDSIITDNLGWTRISGSFIADSAYQYLTIGDFYDDVNTDTANCNYSLALAYYYIDAICVSTDSLYSITWTSVSELNQDNKAVNIFPNPATSKVVITNLKDSEPLTYNLIDVQGQLVDTGLLSKDSNTIDVSGLPQGIYILIINEQHVKLLVAH